MGFCSKLCKSFGTANAFSHRHKFINGSEVSQPAHRIYLTHRQLKANMEGVGHQVSGDLFIS